jgi:hypothetical protein
MKLNTEDSPESITEEDVIKAIGKKPAGFAAIVRRLGFGSPYNTHTKVPEDADWDALYRRHMAARAHISKTIRESTQIRADYSTKANNAYAVITEAEREGQAAAKAEAERLQALVGPYGLSTCKIETWKTTTSLVISYGARYPVRIPSEKVTEDTIGDIVANVRALVSAYDFLVGLK